MKILFLLFTLSGCAALPNTVGQFVQHDSHLTQHRPFTDAPTDYGANLVGMDAHWQKGRVTFDVSEALNLQGRWQTSDQVGHGEIMGPRESFEAWVGWAFEVKK